MEYYNHTSETYLNELKNHMRQMKIKMEILDHNEFAIGEITNYISSDNTGSINVNYEQGCRRSCSFSIIDTKKKFIPTKNSPFWYNRKFKLYIGLMVGDDTYWFPQGVFITRSVSAQGKLINIEGVDKFGLWDGTLGTQMCIVETQVKMLDSKKGVKIIDLIKDTLMLDIGNGVPTDVIEPIIDGLFRTATLYDDIVISEGSYMSELFTTLGDMYGANVYYDVNGHLRFERVFNYNIPSYYRHMSPDYRFTDITLTEDDLSVQYNYDGYNIVTVTTDNTEGEIYTYTAMNKNPQSPVNIYDIGYRGNGEGAVEISLGDTTDCVNGTEKCRQYAEFLLMQNTLMTVSTSFSYAIIPHLDVNHTIEITNDYYNYDKQLFIIKSLTFPLGLGEMEIEVTNIQWLPSDTDSISSLTN